MLLASRPRGLPLLLVLTFLASLGPGAGEAFGHSALGESTPPAGARLPITPREISLDFTEPLNRELSKVTLTDVPSGKPIASTPRIESKSITLEPVGPLGKDSYRVEWRTVSTVDGHTLEGTFGFGVRTAAVGGSAAVEQSPLARGGWLRIATRAVFYAALFFFAGGVINAVLLDRRRRPAAWLIPQAIRRPLVEGGREPDQIASRTWRRTLDAGWLAAASAAAVALIEAADAGGGLSLQGLNDFLLANGAGLARVGTVLCVALAAFLARRMRLAATSWLALALLLIALSGHANSATPRLLAVGTDWVHLLAGSIWIGGLAQIALVWIPLARHGSSALGRVAMREVLARFGKVALPAFALLAASGITNAAIQLGDVDELWRSTYGRVLAVKLLLVSLIAGASYLHALRLRPRLLSANPHPPAKLERRHWRLLGGEPTLAVGVILAAAALVAFPLPPHQLSEGDQAEAAQSPCSPCAIPTPSANQLAVAEPAGSRIVAFTIARRSGRVGGTLRLLDRDAAYVDAPVSIPGSRLSGCGLGCWHFSLPAGTRTVTATVVEQGHTYNATVPARWRRDGNAEAGRLLTAAQAQTRRLTSMRVVEALTSGPPGGVVHTVYRTQAPDRFTYTTSSGAQSVAIGGRQWTRSGNDPWRRGRFGGGAKFQTKDFVRWTPYARVARLVGIKRQGDRRIAELALADSSAPPVWFRLWVDLGSDRVLGDRMTTQGHFMRRRYLDFDRPLTISPPSRVAGRAP